MPCPRYTEQLLQSKRLLDALRRSTNGKATSSVLKLALISFDHQNESMHDQEHKLGAVEILTKCLHAGVVSGIRSHDIERLLQLLAMVYRCSDSTCIDSICNHGSFLLPLLVTAVVATSLPEKCHQVTNAFFNRIKSLSIPLSMLKNSDLLLIAFVRLLKSFSATKRRYALVGLRSFTSSGNSKVTAMRFPGLIDAIIAEQRDCEAEVAKTLASFSLALENKPAFVKTRGVLDTVMRMAKSTDECVVHDACTTIENLSSNYSLRTDLVQFQSGDFITQLFTLLSKSKSDIKDKILQTLANLVGESTASLIAGSDYIIKFLSDIGSESYLAVKIIKRLSKHIDAKHPRHQALCEALIKLSSCDKRDVCLWTARAYVEQSLKMSTRFLIPRCEDLLNGLLLLSQSKHPRVRISALEAVANLFEDGANTRRLSKNEKVLRIIVQSISGKNGGGNTGSGRRHAVRAALLIANHKVASTQAAKHDGLIQSLSKYGTSVDGDVELKQAALYGVLLLAPSM